MSFSLIHVSDPHFGVEGDLQKIRAAQHRIPELEPDVIVLSGDLTQRARHGEFLAARMWVRDLEQSAPVVTIPGNHDVEWWKRPLVPFGAAAKYRKFCLHFGPVIAPTLHLPEAVIAAVVTANGLSWGALTSRARDLSVIGNLPRRETDRVGDLFGKVDPDLVRVVVMHHNMMRGPLTDRVGLTRWKRAQQRIVQTGADLVLCGHDHQAVVDTLDGVVVSCAGTLSHRVLPEAPPAFHRIAVDEDAIHVEQYRWHADSAGFRRNDVHVMARTRRESHADAAAGAV